MLRFNGMSAFATVPPTEDIPMAILGVVAVVMSACVAVGILPSQRGIVRWPVAGVISHGAHSTRGPSQPQLAHR